jgi:hypothetical protein
LPSLGVSPAKGSVALSYPITAVSRPRSLSTPPSSTDFPVNENTAASIFLANNLLGYRNVRSNQHSGPDGGPIPIHAGPDLARLSIEDFEQRQALMDKAEGLPGDNQ